MKYELVDTEWGSFGLVTRGDRLVATFLPRRGRDDVERAIRSLFPGAVKGHRLLPRFRRQVTAYFAGKPTDFSVKLDLSDHPPFRRSVLEACRRIKYGRTASYGDLARAAGVPHAARAVGGVMAHNPMPIVIPCHRVLRSDGSLGGFSSPDGVKEKARLLHLENPSLDGGVTARRSASRRIMTAAGNRKCKARRAGRS